MSHTHTLTHTPYMSSVRSVNEKGGLIWYLDLCWAYGKVSIFFLTQQTLVGHGPLVIEDSRSQSDTPHSVGLLRTSDQFHRRDLYLKTHNPNKRQTSMFPAGFEPTIPAILRPRGHWDRQHTHYTGHM